MSRKPTTQLDSSIVQFCRFGRAQGLSGGVKETLDCLRAAKAVGVENRETLKLALRAVLCSSKNDWDIFEGIFEDFWGTASQSIGHEARKKPNQPTDDWNVLRGGAVELIGAAANANAAQDQGKAVSGATTLERLRRMDFSQIPHNDLPDLERLSQRLLRQMSLRLSRRLKSMSLRGPVNIRRTIRRSISRGGEPVYLSRKGRRLQRARLLILLDVSGSMNPYSVFLLRFAYALQKHFKRVHTFVFSTQLIDITSTLRAQNLPEVLQALSREPAGWSGGTKIGESLRDFNHRFGRVLLSPDTLVMILSDGWDTGEPEVVARELSEMRRRSRQLIWLNPLLGMEGYEPLTRGMAAALPYIHVFAPAHNLESLLQLQHHLGRSRSLKRQTFHDVVSANA